MTRKLDQIRARQDAVQALGKPLARRSGRVCEICGDNSTALRPAEVGPVEDEPSLERTLLLCEACLPAVDNGDLTQRDDWRFIESAVWTETPAAQVSCVRILRRLATDHHWARATLEQLYLSPDVEAWLDG